MKLKILSNVNHNGAALVEGDIVDMSNESEAETLIESGVAEESKAKATKDEPKSKMKSVKGEIIRVKRLKASKITVKEKK